MNYDYVIADFPNGAYALDRLQREIELSPIVTSIDYNLGLSGSAIGCTVNFMATLSAPDLAILDALVAAHSGTPLPDLAIPVKIEQSSTEKLTVKDSTFSGPLYLTFCRFKTGLGGGDPSFKHGGETLWSIDVSTPGLTIVKFSPNFDYQIDGAGFRLRGPKPVNETVFSRVILAPSIPAEYGGSYPFIRNFEISKDYDEYERITAPKYIKYYGAPGPSEIAFEITHDPADFVPLMVFLSIYKVTV